MRDLFNMRRRTWSIAISCAAGVVCLAAGVMEAATDSAWLALMQGLLSGSNFALALCQVYDVRKGIV